MKTNKFELELLCQECASTLTMTTKIFTNKGDSFVYVEPCEKCSKGRDTLREVMEWIDNWEPDFVEDPEWGDLREKVDEVLCENQ